MKDHSRTFIVCQQILAMVQITLCSNNIVEQLQMSPKDTLGDLKSTVYNITGIEPAAQLLDGIQTSKDDVISSSFFYFYLIFNTN